MRAIAFSFATLALVLAGPAFAGEPDRLDALVERERERQRIPGVGIAIVRRGKWSSCKATASPTSSTGFP